MNQIMGKSYLQALTILEEQQVIVRSDSYQSGTQSKCVSLSKKYNSSEIKIREIDHNTPVAKNLVVEKQLRIKKNTKANQQAKEFILQSLNDAARITLNGFKFTTYAIVITIILFFIILIIAFLIGLTR